MILAAAEYAEDDEREPPRELEIMFECREFGVLYRTGGLAEQPAGLMRRMRAAYNVWRAMKAWHEAGNMVKFVRKNPQEWRIVQVVLKMRGEG